MENCVSDTNPLLTLKQAGKLLSQSARTLRVWINKGKITAVDMGGKEYRISLSTIQEFIAQHTINAAKNKPPPSRRKKPVRKVTPSNNAQEDVG